MKTVSKSPTQKLLSELMWAFVLVPPGSELPGRDYWIIALLTFSILILMPAATDLGAAGQRQRFGWWQTIAAVLVSFSLCAPHGTISALFACPWLMLCSLHAWVEIRRLSDRSAGSLCVSASRIFPAIGAAWLVAHRANWTPWNFDPLIVLLTAAHFHHAGFTLPLMAGLNAKASPGRLTKFSCVAILAGVPLVAAGITCTHFGVLPFVEPFGVVILVLGALGVAVSQIQRGLERERRGISRVGFVVSGVSLFAAMLLAMSFGLRYVFPQLALTMPQMWAIHGTLNAFGFGLCGILAWRGRMVVSHPDRCRFDRSS